MRALFERLWGARPSQDLPTPTRSKSRMKASLPHAQANVVKDRHIQLAGQALGYRLVRSRRRTIGFMVDAQGLSVRAPMRAALVDIESAMQQKSAWILSKLTLMRERQEQEQAQAIDWMAPSVNVCFLGQPTLLPASVMRAPDAAGRERAAAQWLMQQARTHFSARLEVWAGLMQLQPSKLRLSSAKTRWGSASGKGVISLHWRLMQFAPEVVDYVVVHELAHLRHMNHSADFWALVKQFIPDYKARCQALKTASPSAWL